MNRTNLRQFPNRITTIVLRDRFRQQITREKLASANYYPQQIINSLALELSSLPDTPFRVIGQKLSKNIPLDFEEAFIGMVYVIMTTNRHIFQALKGSLNKSHGSNVAQTHLLGPSQTFLTSMAQNSEKLRFEQIAGMAAAMNLDLHTKIDFGAKVLEIGGTGGDRGIILNNKPMKTINASTLATLVLASMGIPVIKHGGHANTSAMGASNTIDQLGIFTFQDSVEKIHALYKSTNFYFSDTQVAKTVHDLTHSPLLKYETITHLIGPMSIPVSSNTVLYKLMGVNEAVDPAEIAKAYEYLNAKGYQSVGNVIVVSGLCDNVPSTISPDDYAALKPYMILDEVSPYKSVVSLVRNGKFIGNFYLRPEQFGVKLDAQSIFCKNNAASLRAANMKALQKNKTPLRIYLAMNAALGLFCYKYLSRPDAITNNSLNERYLHEVFHACNKALSSGKALEHISTIRTQAVSTSSDKAILEIV